MLFNEKIHILKEMTETSEIKTWQTKKFNDLKCRLDTAKQIILISQGRSVEIIQEITQGNKDT